MFPNSDDSVSAVADEKDAAISRPNKEVYCGSKTVSKPTNPATPALANTCPAVRRPLFSSAMDNCAFLLYCHEDATVPKTKNKAITAIPAYPPPKYTSQPTQAPARPANGVNLRNNTAAIAPTASRSGN